MKTLSPRCTESYSTAAASNVREHPVADAPRVACGYPSDEFNQPIKGI